MLIKIVKITILTIIRTHKLITAISIITRNDNLVVIIIIIIKRRSGINPIPPTDKDWD